MNRISLHMKCVTARDIDDMMKCDSPMFRLPLYSDKSRSILNFILEAERLKPSGLFSKNRHLSYMLIDVKCFVRSDDNSLSPVFREYFIGASSPNDKGDAWYTKKDVVKLLKILIEANYNYGARGFCIDDLKILAAAIEKEEKPALWKKTLKAAPKRFNEDYLVELVGIVADPLTVEFKRTLKREVIRLKDFYEDLIRERTEAARKEVDAILGKRDADLDELNAKRDKEIFDMIEKQIHNFN